jgi:hypothetical protein
MTRLFAVLGVSLAVALSMAATSFEAEAAKKPKNKQCMATDAAGKKLKFKCGATEKCCYDAVMGKGNCVPANGICL